MQGPMQAMPALNPFPLGLGPWLERLRCWVLAEPMTRPLNGQCCDRLRPRFIAQALQQELPRQLGDGAELVEWQWDSSTGQVRGLALVGNQLQRFLWVPGLETFRLQPVASLRRKRWHLGLLPREDPLA